MSEHFCLKFIDKSIQVLEHSMVINGIRKLLSLKMKNVEYILGVPNCSLMYLDFLFTLDKFTKISSSSWNNHPISIHKNSLSRSLHFDISKRYFQRLTNVTCAQLFTVTEDEMKGV